MKGNFKCPICNKNLSEAMKVLGITEDAVKRLHGDAHVREVVRDIVEAGWDWVGSDDNDYGRTVMEGKLTKLSDVEYKITQWRM
jgi:hypothetical protein